MALGVGYAFADTFTAPTCPPPNCNTSAPVNIGSSNQAKEGKLAIGTTDLSVISTGLASFFSKGRIITGTTAREGGIVINGQMVLNDGSQSANRILVSDANGLATWKDVSTVMSINSQNEKRNRIIMNQVTSYIRFYQCKHINSSNNCDQYNLNSSGGENYSSLPLNTVLDLYDAFVSDDTSSVDHICSLFFPATPFAFSWEHIKRSSPNDNSTVYWSTDKGAFVVRSASGMNSGVDPDAPFVCSSVPSNGN